MSRWDKACKHARRCSGWGIDRGLQRTVVGVWEQGAHASEAAHVLVEAAFVAAVRLGLLRAEAGHIKLLLLNLSWLQAAMQTPSIACFCFVHSIDSRNGRMANQANEQLTW